jgi:hypothetical protein
LALGTYEVGIGLTVALSVVAFVWARHLSWLKRTAFLAPPLIAVAFAAWRWLWQLEAGAAYGHTAATIVFSPVTLIERLGFGIRYNLHQAWADTLLVAISALPTEGWAGQIIAILALAGLVMLPMAIIFLATRVSPPSERTTEENRLVRDRIMVMTKALLVGMVILGAGFFPIILAVAPRAEYVNSRINHLPSIGAAMVIGALLFMLAIFLGRRPRQTQLIALGGLIPLLALGVTTHLLAQRDIRLAWADQKLIWRSLFEQAPDIVDGTHIVILLNEYSIPLKGPRPILSGDLGMSSAIQLLYGNRTLYGHYGYAWPPRVLSADGEYLVYSDRGVRKYLAAETLVFVFGKNDRQLVRISEIEGDNGVLPLGVGRIIDTPTQATDYRWLVSD